MQARKRMGLAYYILNHPVINHRHSTFSLEMVCSNLAEHSAEAQQHKKCTVVYKCVHDRYSKAVVPEDRKVTFNSKKSLYTIMHNTLYLYILPVTLSFSL